MENRELIIDGKNAFPVLFEEIAKAQKSILIRMFIWRNDEIGKEMAKRILDAADRGVRVTIVKDRYGFTCEYMEEDLTSMFHPHLSWKEMIRVKSLELMYHPENIGKERFHQENSLRVRILTHPNIDVKSDALLYDHTKLYLFDERVMIFGGVNIEDKENGTDREGRAYHDFMIRLEGEAYVQLYHRRIKGDLSEESEMFSVNSREGIAVYEMEGRFLELIRGAEKELTILMAYFSPVKEIMDALKDALKRGVSLRIMIPEHANVADDINRKTMSLLFQYAKEQGCDLSIYLHPGMPHTKLLMSEKKITIGSCNITRNAFHELCELNYFTDNDDTPFAGAVRTCVEERLGECVKVRDIKELSCNPLRVLAEGLKF